MHSALMDIPEPVAEEEYEIEVAMNRDDMEPDEWNEQGILADGPEPEGNKHPTLPHNHRCNLASL